MQSTPMFVCVRAARCAHICASLATPFGAWCVALGLACPMLSCALRCRDGLGGLRASCRAGITAAKAGIAKKVLLTDRDGLAPGPQ